MGYSILNIEEQMNNEEQTIILEALERAHIYLEECLESGDRVDVCIWTVAKIIRDAKQKLSLLSTSH